MGLLVGIFLTLLLSASVSNDNNFGMMRMMGFGSDNLDRHFIEQMIPHHEGAIEMAKLAQERSKRPEILALAETIIQSQSQEISKMQSWYKKWYGNTIPVNPDAGIGMGRGMMHGGIMGTVVSDIQSLKDATNFDEAFLQEMIPHHQMAVMMAQMLAQGTNRPEMKQLAQDIIKAQETEIEQMRSWLESWSL
ncbi:DUF305 domain-containing protein [Candidatus Uhrbacteria bacterium]|nr:DUF305 domain-containing protein [Candidatus Uhrbacteria bacterium]